MEKNKKRIKQKPMRIIKYPGIRPISRALGITPSHLWKVLEGYRVGRVGLVDEFWKRSEQHCSEQRKRRLEKRS